MSLLLDVRRGDPKPQILHLPPDVHSLAAAQETIELADAYLICDGHPLAENQRITLEAGLGERKDGSWAATRIADFGPRQGTGKNDKIAARELAGLILFGERLIIHTAHEFPTANEAFLRMVAVFENWDDLRKRVARIRYANGEQGIEFLSGQRLKYRARTGGSGRGFAKADLLVYDEAQHLAREHVAASGPAKLANPNSQTWYAGSGGLALSKVAWSLRRAALMGTGGRLAYTEKTGEQVTVVDGRIVQVPPDPLDRDVWYSAIAGLGRWVTEEGVEALYDELQELFPREVLCVWEPEPDSGQWLVIPSAEWVACKGTGLPAGPLEWAVDVSPDGGSSGIGCSDGTTVDLTDHGRGTNWVVGRLKELRVRHGFQRVVLDPAGPVNALLPAVRDAGFTVVEVTAREHAQACGMLLAAVLDGTMRHLSRPPLDAAVAGADRRPLGDAWAWSRSRSNVDISPLVAVTLAFHAARARQPVAAGLVDPNDYDEE